MDIFWNHTPRSHWLELFSKYFNCKIFSTGMLSHAGLVSLSRFIGTGLMIVFGAMCIRGNPIFFCVSYFM